MTDYALGTTIYLHFTTRAFATGVPTQLAGTPALSVLEENNSTPITAGVSVSVDRASVTGLNEVTIVATSGNGYESGKEYALYISTGTVGGVSVVGEVVGHFTIEKSSALRPTTTGRTLVVDASGLADTNVVKVGPTGSGTAQTAGDIPARLPAALTAAGNMKADALALNGSTAAAARNALASANMLPGTVDTGAFTPTTTQFEADDITEATADHFIGRIIIFTSGDLQYQATTITDYALSGSNGHFTVVALTEAPANNGTFIII